MMNKGFWLVLIVFPMLFSACGNKDSRQDVTQEANNQNVQVDAEKPSSADAAPKVPEETQAEKPSSADAAPKVPEETQAEKPSSADAAPNASDKQNDKQNEGTTQEKPPCLKLSMPFCRVVESDGECDPKLNENHHKVGDQLYWINYAQYDTVDCYYTEEEYNKNHDPKDCVEIQDDGKGCIIDESPECTLMIDDSDCSVTYTRSYCDERLLELNKNVGDHLPGVWDSKKQKMQCFYTKSERDQFLKKNKMECKSSFNDLDNVCVAEKK